MCTAVRLSRYNNLSTASTCTLRTETPGVILDSTGRYIRPTRLPPPPSDGTVGRASKQWSVFIADPVLLIILWTSGDRWWRRTPRSLLWAGNRWRFGARELLCNHFPFPEYKISWVILGLFRWHGMLEPVLWLGIKWKFQNTVLRFQTPQIDLFNRFYSNIIRPVRLMYRNRRAKTDGKYAAL